MRSRRRIRKTGSNFQRFLAKYIVALSIVLGIVFFLLVRDEVKNSKFQSQYLSAITKQLSFKLAAGSNTSVRYPEYGPYDQRLGYTALPEIITRLEKVGYGVDSQATFSPKMTELADYGLFNIYHEKSQAGLRITDKSDKVVFNVVYPANGYPNFKAVPPLILGTLLFIENRELLNDDNTTVNPAIEWDRLGYAGLQLVAQKLGVIRNIAGGSTLATQIEKYRHSKNGYTNSVVDKFRQMGTASLRAYMMGPNTREMRQEIALSYLNSMPLAATPKLGEIHGLGDGLSAWFGTDFDQVNALLSANALKPPRRITQEQAKAYRQVLNILLSQRRPSYFLGKGYDALQNLTDKYLRILSDQGVISTELRDATLKVANVRPSKVIPTSTHFFTEKKTQNVLRARLAKTLGVKSNYDLDRFDLTVKTTLDYATQRAVTNKLKLLNQPNEARAAGILGFRMLNENVDLSPIVYSLMLFERGDTGNLLRIQTDNYDQPLDINEGIRLDLGSTSKLRTMVHYLELITDIYQQYNDVSGQALRKIELHPRDNLSAWVIEQLRLFPNIKLEDLLNKALDRKYSANPGEYFFTGGGLHHFNNFTKDEDSKIMSVRHALRDSVNLVFIRLMRDIVYHHLYKPDGLARWLENTDNAKRKEYLERFADNEGQVYLRRFYDKYYDKTSDEVLEMLTKKVLAKPSRFTMLYRSIYPDRSESELKTFLIANLGKASIANEDIYELYDQYSIEKFDLQDQGYITKVHPLELWLAGYLAQHPQASRQEVIKASYKQRQDVYRWLFNNHRKMAQQRRIITMLEEEAFNKIHSAWERVGYPFDSLTPSYATSIGASGDRPAALAELMGILVNDGIRLPVVRFESLHYAQGTPYETVMKKMPDQGQRIFAPEIAKVSRGALIGVVDGGTASRVNGIYTDAEGKLLPVGGKTGTGDHRKQIWGPGGVLLDSKFISRAATFTFFIGDRFFGVITAYVQGENSGLYHFTSSLPVQIVKFLKPTLSPLINNTLPVEIIEPSSKVIVADNVAPVVKVADYSGEKPLLNKPIVTLSNPQVNNASEKVVSAVVKAPVNKLVKRQINTMTPKAEKLTDNTKISPVVKKDSATRYFKYPAVVQPTN
jgi:membrane peptidoglycan carboxypeptidase